MSENTTNGRILLTGIWVFLTVRWYCRSWVKSSGWILACPVSRYLLYNCSEGGEFRVTFAGLQPTEMGFPSPVRTEVWRLQPWGRCPAWCDTQHACCVHPHTTPGLFHFGQVIPMCWWQGMSVEVERNWIKLRQNVLVRHPTTAPNWGLSNVTLDKEFKLVDGGVNWQNIPNCGCLQLYFEKTCASYHSHKLRFAIIFNLLFRGREYFLSSDGKRIRNCFSCLAEMSQEWFSLLHFSPQQNGCIRVSSS